MRMRAIFSTMLIILASSTLGKEATLEQHLKDDTDLSQFYSMLVGDKAAEATLKYRPLTLFAPTNRAFQSFGNNRTSILYHMSTSPTALENLATQIPSDMGGNPPLYITRKRKGGHDAIYINNAMVMRGHSNLVMKNELGEKQYLHVIDEVLHPLTKLPKSSLDNVNGFTAFQLLTHWESLDIGGYKIKQFGNKVIGTPKEKVFNTNGFHTYFIPVDEGFKPPPRSDLFDARVIDAHVVPDRVIFTAAAPFNEPLATLTFEDNLKVQVTFFTQSEGKHTKTYVKSQTLIGDGKHSEGVKIVEIVRANIPVKNGVVHFISKPLMIVDGTVDQFLQMVNDKPDGTLRKFYEVITQVGGEFMKTITDLKNVTLLAPSNEAWIEANLDELMKDKAKIRDILNMHLIKDRLNTEEIKRKNANSISQIPTNNDKRFLYFNVVTSYNNNDTVTVEGGGVNATIIQPDLVATNGYVHIIDRVLGSPFTTMLQKLKTDPMLNSTYQMGVLTQNFNEKLDDRNKKFTFFVPRDKAWHTLQRMLPSVHKKLFMSDFAYHAQMILERHLVIADKAFSMADLMSRGSNDTFVVMPAYRGEVKIKVREEERSHDEIELDGDHTSSTGYQIFWRNRWINVFRPDVQCTNGIIHVIDYPLVEESDVMVTKGAMYSGSSKTIITTSALILLPAALAVLTRWF